MAFFDFDQKVQALLIAGAMASMTGCGCGMQAVDPAPDTFDMYEVVDPAPDVIDSPTDVPDAVDPAPDVIDMTPDPEDEDVDEDAEEDAEDAVEAALPHSFIRTRIRHEDVSGGVRLGVEVSRAQEPTFAWAASAGELVADGATATWKPPSEAGVHAVQVTVRSGDALSIETYKITKA